MYFISICYVEFFHVLNIVMALEKRGLHG